MENWTPTGRETVKELRAHLTKAGLTVGTLAAVPSAPRAAMPAGLHEPAATFVPGLVASEAVKGMADGFAKIKADGMGALAAVVASTPVILGLSRPGEIMATLGRGMAQDGDPQWLTVNLNVNRETIASEPREGEPWAIRDARKAVAAGRMTQREAVQSVFDTAAVHEFGHVLNNLTGNELEARFTDAAVYAAGSWQAAPAWAQEHVSAYAASQPAEGAAEAFAAVAYTKPLPAALDSWSRLALREAKTGEAWAH